VALPLPSVRIQSPGAIYHVINRREQRENSFREDEDRDWSRHSAKVELARLIGREAEMSLKWIAARLRMGRWTYLSYWPYWLRADVKPTPSRQGLLSLCQ
jgi:hypothetical protein